VTASYGTFRDENERDLRDVLITKKVDFLAVGGYDERIALYGGESDELYARLVSQRSLVEGALDLDKIRHNPPEDGSLLLDLDPSSQLARELAADAAQQHSKTARAMRLLPSVSLRYNKNLLHHLPTWNAEMAKEIASEYALFRVKHSGLLAARREEARDEARAARAAVSQPNLEQEQHQREQLEQNGFFGGDGAGPAPLPPPNVDDDDEDADGDGGGGVELREDVVVGVARRVAPSVSELVGSKEGARSLRLASEVTLHDDFGVPWDVIAQLDTRGLTELVSHVERVSSRNVIVLVANGVLADRLAALSFALAVAVQNERVLLVVWDGGYKASTPDDDDRVRPVNAAEVLDLVRVNKRLEQDGVSTRVLGVPRWKCERTPESCVPWDAAYAKVDQVWLDELVGELPVAPRKHLVMRMWSWPARAGAAAPLVIEPALLRETRDAWQSLQFVADVRMAATAAETDVRRRTGVYVGVRTEDTSAFVDALQARRGLVARLRNGKKRFVIAGSDLKATRAVHDTLYGVDGAFLAPLELERDAGGALPRGCDELPVDDSGVVFDELVPHDLRLACVKRMIVDVVTMLKCPVLFPAPNSDADNLVDRPGMQAIIDLTTFVAPPD